MKQHPNLNSTQQTFSSPHQQAMLTPPNPPTKEAIERFATAGMVAKLILIDGFILITYLCWNVRHWNDANF